MTNEQIRSLGEYSHALLASEEFKTLNVLFEQQVAVDVLGTKPDRPEDRERLFATLQGSRAFTSLIESFAHAWVELTATDVPAAQDPIDDPGVHDIYGNS